MTVPFPPNCQNVTLGQVSTAMDQVWAPDPRPLYHRSTSLVTYVDPSSNTVKISISGNPVNQTWSLDWGDLQQVWTKCHSQIQSVVLGANGVLLPKVNARGILYLSQPWAAAQYPKPALEAEKYPISYGADLEELSEVEVRAVVAEVVVFAGPDGAEARYSGLLDLTSPRHVLGPDEIKGSLATVDRLRLTPHALELLGVPNDGSDKARSMETHLHRLWVYVPTPRDGDVPIHVTNAADVHAARPLEIPLAPSRRRRAKLPLTREARQRIGL
jgi:hypothetical protein